MATIASRRIRAAERAVERERINLRKCDQIVLYQRIDLPIECHMMERTCDRDRPGQPAAEQQPPHDIILRLDMRDRQRRIFI